MASTGQPPSLKRRDSSVTREEDKLVVTPLGAGNEVGRSCVYMSYKGKIVLVRHQQQNRILFFDHLFSSSSSSLFVILIFFFIFSGS